jgi:hypothetical protein
MGVLIVVGVGVLAWGLATRLDLSRPMAVDGRVTLPREAKVLDMTASGDRLVLRVALPDNSERLVIVDLARGRQLGSLELVRP